MDPFYLINVCVFFFFRLAIVYQVETTNVLWNFVKHYSIFIHLGNICPISKMLEAFTCEMCAHVGRKPKFKCLQETISPAASKMRSNGIPFRHHHLGVFHFIAAFCSPFLSIISTFLGAFFRRCAPTKFHQTCAEIYIKIIRIYTYTDDICRQLRRTSVCPDTDRRRHVDLEWPQTCSGSSFGTFPPRFAAASTIYTYEGTDDGTARRRRMTRM